MELEASFCCAWQRVKLHCLGGFLQVARMDCDDPEKLNQCVSKRQNVLLGKISLVELDLRFYEAGSML